MGHHWFFARWRSTAPKCHPCSDATKEKKRKRREHAARPWKERERERSRHTPPTSPTSQAGVELGATVDAFRARQATADAKEKADASPPFPSSPSRRPARKAAPALRPKERPPISRVLLVGAPTKAPGFRAFVRNLTGLAGGARSVCWGR